ncbi:putative Mg2+ transporter-C (MgtC) family protein [Scopulibacillus darangshiensis]|uniref:Putative Mg2+ transporter-C (MgtC) family protein n=1 Tax=Scopulibacillus darangshiensis TaxID=442528 RepID=A0A4R2PBN7_9BACL|nr:MgtC/SapB family protein [Scopulibacillus darangshiensis]TCP31541.1 putative Mg2+ transporter-C (MgtC) family protein [Scopulibacillus darangshiensis]
MGIEVVLLRLGLSAVLGMVIGLERELKQKPLGLKTCIIISVSSCLLTIVSIQGAIHYSEMTDNIRTDPMRLSAQIVSGIGFIGAGVILRRGTLSVSGVTTAAIIWGASGLGIAVGSGFYYESITGGLIILFTVKILPFLISRYGPKKLSAQELKISIFINEINKLTEIINELKTNQIKIKHLRIKDLPEDKFQMDLNVLVLDHSYTTDVYFLIRNITSVKNVEIETY